MQPKPSNREKFLLFLTLAAFFAVLIGANMSHIKDPTGGAPQFPVIRGAGAPESKAGSVTASLPSGTEDGDLLLLFFSARNEATPTATDWTALPSCPNTVNGSACPSPNDCASAHVLYNVWADGDNTTISDVGSVNRSVVLGITSDSFDTSDPFDTCASDVDTSQSATVSVTGPATTIADTAVFVFTVSGVPDQNGTMEYSAWANGALASIVEQVDVKKNTAAGGSYAVVSATKASAGAIGNTMGTQARISERASVTFTVNSKP